MPYVPKTLRTPYAKASAPVTAGELNYRITELCLEFMTAHGRSYATYCTVEGVLNHVSKEFYRRSAAPYEDRKIIENGDVFPEEWTT
jgi:hypothetical protein